MRYRKDHPANLFWFMNQTVAMFLTPLKSKASLAPGHEISISHPRYLNPKGIHIPIFCLIECPLSGSQNSFITWKIQDHHRKDHMLNTHLSKIQVEWTLE